MRPTGVSLLDRDDHAVYDQPGRRVRREIELVSTEPLARKEAKRLDLEAELQSVIGKAKSSGTHVGTTRWSRAVCIEVRENDGMSWSAEAVRRLFVSKYPGFEVFAVRNEAATDRLPVIATILGETRLLRIAIRNKLADEYPTFRSWRSVLLIVLTIALMFTRQLTDLVVRDIVQHPGPTMATTLAYALLAAAIIGVIMQWLVATRPVLSRDRSEKAFRASLAKIREKGEYDGFVEELSVVLSMMAEPRFIVIDNYEALDEVTQDVVERYFADHHSRAAHSEMWVVFERESGDRLSAHALESWKSDRHLRPLLYRQRLLTPDERRTLAEKCGDASRASFSAVKWICRRGAGESEFIEKLLEPFLSRHESSLVLPYFHLLAMAVPDLAPEHRDSAIGSNVFFSWDWLGADDERDSTTIALDGLTREEERAHKSALRPAVLAAFFGRTLNKTDVNSVAREIKSKLAPLLIESSNRNAASFAVARETAIFLYDRAEEWGLPNPATAKLFWTFAFSQRKNVLRPFWLRRVVHHLLEVDLAKLPDSLKRGVVMTELRNTTLNLIDSALKCGLVVEVAELIRYGRLLIADYDDAPVASAKKLRRFAWEAYHLTGGEEVLRELVQIDTPEEMPPAPVLTPLQRVFSQSLALVPKVRTVLEAYLFVENATGDVPEAQDYALARACWLTLQAAPFLARVSRNPRSYGILDATGLRETVRGLAERATARLTAKGEDVSTLDVATLSLSVWCTALLLDISVLECCTQDAPVPALVWAKDDESKRHFVLALEAKLSLDRELVPLARNAVIVASAFLRDARRGGAPHFVAGAMVNEMCSMALAAVWLGRALAGKEPVIGVVDGEEQVRKLLADVDETLGTSLAATAQPFTSPDVRASIEDLLRVTAMVWHRFSLERLSEYTSLRYVHFAFTVNAIHAEDEERQRPLLATIEPLVREQHFSGIAANLTLALCLLESKELSAIHLQQAALLAEETSFGDDLQAALALLAILNIGGRTDALGTLVESVLRSVDGAPPAVVSFLAQVPEDQLNGAALDLINGARSADPPSSVSKLTAMVDAIRRRVDTVTNADVRRELEAMIEYFLTEASIRRRTVDVDDLLAAWSMRRDLWLYASLLRELRRAGLGGTALHDEAMKILNRDADRDRFNSWYHLALDLAEEQDGESPAIHYVDRVVRRFENVEYAETNMRAYALLRNQWPRNPAYTGGIVKWQRVIIRRDRIQKLPQLIEQGKFYLLFADNFEHMRVWGLPIDIPQQRLQELRRQPPAERAEWLAQWVQRGGHFPEPFVIRNGDIAVTSDFVILGDYLFDSAFDHDERFLKARETLNERARAALPRLVEEVGRLSHTPPEIRALLRLYASSYADPG